VLDHLHVFIHTRGVQFYSRLYFKHGQAIDLSQNVTGVNTGGFHTELYYKQDSNGSTCHSHILFLLLKDAMPVSIRSELFYILHFSHI